MQERHVDRKRYFNEQIITSKKYIYPFIQSAININKDVSVLEIGCGEGGNLKPFLDADCHKIVGIDLSKNKIKNATVFFKEHKNRDNIKFIYADIYDIDNIGKFDIIIMRDVLEHIHNQEKFMNYVKKFLNKNGKFFLGFPPWHNPFGGHQQICESKILSSLPYFHILPKFIYKFILKLFGEKKNKIEALLEIKDTGITIERFERILKETGYKKDKTKFYFINPNYEIKFGLKPRVLFKIFSNIPLLRDFLITTNYYIISVK